MWPSPYPSPKGKNAKASCRFGRGNFSSLTLRVGARNLARLNHLHAGGPHLLDGPPRVVGLQIDAAAKSIFDQPGFEAERRWCRARLPSRSSRSPARGCKLRRRLAPANIPPGWFSASQSVPKLLNLLAFASTSLKNTRRMRCCIQRGGQFVVCISYTVNRPQRLRSSVEHDHVARVACRTARRQTDMIGRMPVLRGHDQIEPRLQGVRQRNHFVALRNGSAPPGKEVVLQNRPGSKLS